MLAGADHIVRWGGGYRATPDASPAGSINLPADICSTVTLSGVCARGRIVRSRGDPDILRASKTSPSQEPDGLEETKSCRNR